MSTRVYDCIARIGEVITEHKDFLTDLDREIGDADHGVNMARGFHAVKEKVPQDNPDIGAVLKKTGMTLSPEDFKAILEAAIAGIQKRGKAVEGEKTMLDAIIPAYKAYCEKLAAGEGLEAGLDAACEAAKKGVEFTKTIRATKGRASYLGDRSIGHQDPGATSATYTLETIRDFIKG